METEWISAEKPVSYRLPVGDMSIPMNMRLGRKIRLSFTGEIRCLNCDKATPESFSQGYCLACSQTLARCDTCTVRPETCHFHKGTCREPLWAEKNCFIDHVVYLANSSGLKVGITRAHQRWTRWADQGAMQALPIAMVKNRYDSGKLEVLLAQTYADKSQWRKLLQGNPEPLDLKAEAERALALLGNSVAFETLPNEAVVEMKYPVREYPTKITSLNLHSEGEVGGVLQGIKGQYLIFDNGVLNIRKFGGYRVAYTEG